MGPLRRGLRHLLSPRGQGYGFGIAATVFPNIVWAGVCDQVRPYWDGTHVNMFEEVFGQLSNPFTAIVVGLSIALILQKKLKLILLGVLAITSYVVLFADPLFLDDARWEAKREGCIGNQEMWWAVLATVALFGLFRMGSTVLRVAK